jgi:hypothetical protein
LYRGNGSASAGRDPQTKAAGEGPGGTCGVRVFFRREVDMTRQGFFEQRAKGKAIAEWDPRDDIGGSLAILAVVPGRNSERRVFPASIPRVRYYAACGARLELPRS